MTGRVWRIGLMLTALMLTQPARAEPRTPRFAEYFRIGSEGASCEAQGVRLGQARTSAFDRKWALICRDVDRPIGTAYSWRTARPARVSSTPSSAAVTGCGPSVPFAAVRMASVRQCKDSASGLDWLTYSVRSGGWLHVVEGYAAFDSALRLALASLAEDREVRGNVEIVTTGNVGSLGRALSAAQERTQMIGQGYRRNNAGDYTQAEELFRSERQDPGGVVSDATLAEREHEALANRALQLSNLGNFDEAAKLFERARAMSLRDGIQARLLRNFEAIDAINRARLDDVAAILARPVPALEQPV